ncbi:DUF1553 domain-containing protein [Aureliella helgolandensis]|uniref:Planctomycete cytochrome C n=1 Tax=Aureliella helgolandensis TaxID=2527968 RepID=A0A518G377_9BACT|nr:DUF1553 domain-containing protein [Aureliella helgolandensis]QDV22989.1 Planctomycete cytochrome C [Aureliella helgolandensis]
MSTSAYTTFLSVALCFLTISCACSSEGTTSKVSQEEFFRERVAPILQRRCLSCHNHAERKGDFSLQSFATLLESSFLEPGDAAASHLMEVIAPSAGAPEMPKDSDPLTEQQITDIRTWIDAGAVWPSEFELEPLTIEDYDWWSYQPVVAPAVPRTSAPWGRTVVDQFILKSLKQQGLAPSPEADRRTLIRRLTFDLVGLPPSPAEVEEFVNDPDPLAYEALVDRLLESERYGERWARHWLDVVKYADTCGYDKDKLRPNAWPYRDYVIRSFNEDKPYGRFVQEQIAGDALFPGTADGILGLGFIAAGPWDFIGHVEVPESKIDGQVARNLDRDDMVSNVFNTFCSVTIQCARCHNHKFDPITQEDYYGLQAMFAAVDRADRPYDLDPSVERQRQELVAQQRQLKQSLQQLEQEMASAGGQPLLDLKHEIEQSHKSLNLEKQPAFGYHSQLVQQPSTEKWIELQCETVQEIGTVVLHPCHDDYASIGAGFGFPIRFKLEAAREDGEWQLLFDHTQEDFSNPGLTELKVAVGHCQTDRIRLTATKLAERKGDFFLAMAEIELLNSSGRSVSVGAVQALDSIEAAPRWAADNVLDGVWPMYSDPRGAQRLSQAMQERDALLRAIETPERIAQRTAWLADLQRVDRKLSALPAGKMVYAAATHFSPQGNFKPTNGKPRQVHVLHRGNVQQPLQVATPRVLKLNSGEDTPSNLELDSVEEEAQRRVALAQWLTRPDHPLVWRSIVNRVWQYHFGEGLVATPNDFGRMGARPTHPKLLDWLAADFRDHGQSFKRLHRLLVTSSVYRQSSQGDVTQEAIDGGNQYWWRMNRRRLAAEEVRDSILSVSGALNLEMGGPGFYLFELEKPEHSPHFEYHKFDPATSASHRRSIYRFVVRSQPDPWMTTLDCADSSQSTPRRTETLTSLQALSLLNNPFNLHMAEQFAERVGGRTAGDSSASTQPSDSQFAEPAEQLQGQVEQAFRLVTQRQPSESELSEMTHYAAEHGLANLCRMLFNLHEFVFLD